MLELPTHYLTETDKDVFDEAGYGKRQGLGQHPVLLVVDMTYNFIGDRSLPILEAVKERRGSCGDYGWRSLPAIREVIDQCRAVGCPIVYTRISDQDLSGSGRGFGSKNHRAGSVEQVALAQSGNQVIEEIAPEPEDWVLDKQKPSAFFATPLSSYMVAQGIDSVIIVGCTTSGCVRATAVDAFSLNYPVTVVAPAVFDRFQLSHYASLFDLDCKYADVVDIDTLDEGLRTLGGA